MPIEYQSSLSARPIESTKTVSIGSISLPARKTYAERVPAPEFPIPTAQRSHSELATQVDSLRSELRDGRLVQARQRNQIAQDSTRIRDLEFKIQDAKRLRECLQLDLKASQNATLAAERRLDVAVDNHSKAFDKFVRTSADAEVWRLTKEKVERQLEEKEGQLQETETQLKNAKAHIKTVELAMDVGAQMKRQLKKQLKQTEGFLEQAEERLEQAGVEHNEEFQAMQQELANRELKISQLESDLKRQREINAMFSIDYDRDTNFTMAVNVPVSIPSSVASSSPAGPSKTCLGRKRSRSAYTYSENVENLPSKSSKLDLSSGYETELRSYYAHSKDNCPKNITPARSRNSTGVIHEGNTQLPTPSPSMRLNKRL